MPGFPNPINWLGSQVGSAVKSLAGDAFDSMAKDFASAATALLAWLWREVGSSTAVRFGGSGFDRLVAVVMGIAVVVAMGLFLVQIITSTLRRDTAGLARAGKGLLVAFLGGAAAIAVTNILLAAVDALSNGVVKVLTGGSISALGRGIMGTAGLLQLTPAVMLLFSLVVIVAVAFIWAALMIRKLLLVIAAVFAPVAFAGALADISTGWVKKWMEGMAALIVSKLLLVIMLLVGYYMVVHNLGSVGARGVAGASPTGTQAITQVAAGAAVLLLGAFAPWIALKTVHFAGDHMAQLHAHATSAKSGVTTAIGAPQKLAAMKPSRGGPTRPPGRAGASAAGGGGAAGGGAAGGAAAGAALGATAVTAPKDAAKAAKNATVRGVENASAHMNGNGSSRPWQGPGSPPAGSPSHPGPPPHPGPMPPPPKST